MATKITSVRAELAVLRGLCHKNKTIAGTLLSLIDSSYFYSEESVELFKTIRKHMLETGKPPTYRLLIEDPDISDEARTHLRNSVVSIQTIEDAQKAARILNRYRQNRGMFNIASYINTALNGNKRVNTDELMEQVATSLNIVRSRKSNQNSFQHFGKNDNSEKMIEDILWGDSSESIIPTGIRAFDEESGGWARGSLVTLASNSGGGKSTLANAIAMHMAVRGYKVLLVPLEMSKREMTGRILANASRMDVSKILLQKLASGEKELAYKRLRRWRKKVRDAGGRYTMFKPEEDMTMHEVITATSAYKCDVRIIDYTTLLKGADGDEQWKVLGAIARYAKINAEVDDCVNVLLCQLSEEMKIRYSRAINEHSSNSWIWKATEESKENGITRIEQGKSRNSRAFPFNVKINYSHMRVEDIPQDQVIGEIRSDKSRNEIKNLAESDI